MLQFSYTFLMQEITVPLSAESHGGKPVDYATLFLAHPKTQLTGPTPFNELLQRFDPRPHLAVLTGPCLPLVDCLKTSDIVVVSCQTPLPIEGEVQYWTELWRIRDNQMKQLFPKRDQPVSLVVLKRVCASDVHAITKVKLFR